MNKITRSVSLILAGTILLASCSSTTMIESNPPKAKVYIDGQLMGETPYTHTDTRIVGSSMTVKLQKDGFKPLIASISKDEDVDVGAVIGGIFFVVPYLWILKYKPVHTYSLIPLGNENNNVTEPQQTQQTQTSKVIKLRELKKLLDEKIITQEEFEKEKAKVLEEKE